jgi:hypothetical protein
MPVHLYAVTLSDHPPPGIPGAGGPSAAVRIVSSGSVAAAVSELPDGARLTDQDAATHLDVLVALHRDGPVIPVRFGTVAPDDAAVRDEVLASAASSLESRLAALDGLVEVHLDAEDDERFAIRQLVAEDPGLRGGGDSRDLGSLLELGHEVGARLVQRRERQAETVLSCLRPLVVRDTPRSRVGGPEDPVLRWAFLVEKGKLWEVDDEVARLRAEMPELSFSYVGPLPVMSFLEENLEPENTPSHRQHDSFGGDSLAEHSRWGW